VNPSITDDEIRAMLDANLARAWEIHERAEARKAAEMAAEANVPSVAAPLTPDEPTGSAKLRIGPAMKRVLVYLSQQNEPVTCATVYWQADIGGWGSPSREPLWRCERARLVRIDRARVNRYGVTITASGREYVESGRAAPGPAWDDAMRWTPDEILDRIDQVLSQQ